MLGIKVNLALLPGDKYTAEYTTDEGEKLLHRFSTRKGADGFDYITDVDPETSHTLKFWGGLLKIIAQVAPIVELDGNGDFVVVEFEPVQEEI